MEPAGAAGSAPKVVLEAPDDASGLADMLSQFLEQTVTTSARKAGSARALRGEVVFRAQEDDQIAVRISFQGDQIVLTDLGGATLPGAPTIQGGFLAVAHVTSGQSSPFGALARRELTVRFSPSQLPFLVRVLGLLRLEGEAPRRLRLAWLSLAMALVATLAAWLWWSR
ncbi:MAG: hypothetical protein IT376_01055 [Polyangiaceae bacterium]|nr:hypothetical protein [Polyangiaceae bacterium]